MNSRTAAKSFIKLLIGIPVPLPSLCAVPGRGREAHSRNPPCSLADFTIHTTYLLPFPFPLSQLLRVTTIHLHSHFSKTNLGYVLSLGMGHLLQSRIVLYLLSSSSLVPNQHWRLDWQGVEEENQGWKKQGDSSATKAVILQ